jgi:predicted nucleic acid-binding Zn finger protein
MKLVIFFYYAVTTVKDFQKMFNTVTIFTIFRNGTINCVHLRCNFLNYPFKMGWGGCILNSGKYCACAKYLFLLHLKT